MLDQRRLGRHRIEDPAEVFDVGDPGLLVHHQVLRHMEILGLGLEPEPRRRVAIVAAVVHVNVEIPAEPPLGREINHPPERDSMGNARTRDGNRIDPPGVLEPLGRLEDITARGHVEPAQAGSMKIGEFESAVGPAKAVVGMSPGVRREIAAAVRAATGSIAPPGTEITRRPVLPVSLLIVIEVS